MFNTLHYAKMLEAVDFTREQAEACVKILVEIMEDKLASKHDLRELEYRLTIRMGTMFAASIAILTAIITAIQKLA